MKPGVDDASRRCDPFHQGARGIFCAQNGKWQLFLSSGSLSSSIFTLSITRIVCFVFLFVLGFFCWWWFLGFFSVRSAMNYIFQTMLFKILIDVLGLLFCFFFSFPSSCFPCHSISPVIPQQFKSPLFPWVLLSIFSVTAGKKSIQCHHTWHESTPLPSNTEEKSTVILFLAWLMIALLLAAY